jgi:hypothetical protein
MKNLSIEEQFEKAKQMRFKPDQILVMGLGITKYDAVEHINKEGQIEQKLSDVNQASQDIETVKECMLKFSVPPENFINFPD